MNPNILVPYVVCIMTRWNTGLPRDIIIVREPFVLIIRLHASVHQIYKSLVGWLEELLIALIVSSKSSSSSGRDGYMSAINM